MKFTQVYLLGQLFASAIAISPPSNNSKLPIQHDRANCEKACTALAFELSGRLHYKDSDSNSTIWDQKQLETNYICRVQPESAIEVSRILQILVGSWCRFAVKCGGHSRFPDDSVSPGFTLGGGSSVLAAKYGWALDNVLQYEVVLPNATIVTASENTYPDLYYALRGGGNNFGIVTSFNISVFPQGPLYTDSRTFGNNQTGLVLKEAEKICLIGQQSACSLSYGSLERLIRSLKRCSQVLKKAFKEQNWSNPKGIESEFRSISHDLLR